MKAKIFFTGILFAVFFLVSLSYADVPQMINYQGKLTTASGGCVGDTTISMTFKIYADLTTPTSLWSETQDSVKVEDGIFNVLLGSVNPIPDSVFDRSTRYLGVKVGADNEMSPRKPLVSVGYAFHSESSDTAEYALNADKVDGYHVSDLDGRYVNEGQSNSVTSAMIVNSTITQSDIATDGVGSAEIASNAVGASEIATGAVGTSEIADNTITQLDIATNGVGSAEIASNAVGASEIATGAVGTSEIADNTITQSDIATNGVGSAEIAAGAVGSSEISDNSITQSDIATNGVGSAEIATDAVGSSEIAANAVGASEIASNSVGRVDLSSTFKAQYVRVNTVNANEYVWNPNWYNDSRPAIRTTGTAGRLYIYDSGGGVSCRVVIKENGTVVYNGSTPKTYDASDGKLIEIYVWPYTFIYQWYVHFTGARERYNSSNDHIAGLVRAGTD